MVDPVCEDLVTTVSATELCLGELLTLEATALSGGTVTWDGGVVDGVSFVSPVGIIPYTATSDDPADCPFSVDIKVFDLPVVTASADDDAICLGDLVIFTGAGAVTYVWDIGVTDGTAFEPITDGAFTFTVIGTDVNGCENSASVDLLVSPIPLIDAGLDVLVCEDEVVTLSGLGAGIGGSYAWDGGVADSVTFSPVATATYTVTGTSAAGCFSTDEVLVMVSATPSVDAGADQTICQGDMITLTGTGAGVGGTYVWDGGVFNGVSFMPLITATYTVTGANAAGCESTDNVTVSVNPLPNVAFTGDFLAGCAPLTTNFTNLVAGSSYTWNFGDGAVSGIENPSNTFTNPGLFDVTLTVTSAAGCSTTVTYFDYINVTQTPIANFSFNPTELDILNTTTYFDNTSSFATVYDWTFGDGGNSGLENPVHIYPEDGNRNYEITLIASNEYGCADTLVKSIEVKDVLIYFAPNTFTPNGDSFNDSFKPVFASGLDVYDFHLMIFNRWGEMVFESYTQLMGGMGFMVQMASSKTVFTFGEWNLVKL